MTGRWIRWAGWLSVVAGLALAQTTTGIITGRVVDPQGHAVPAAEVWLTQELTGVRRTTTTDATGDFVFPSVPPGRYSITVNAQGFKRLEKKGYTLTAFERLSVGTLTLELGSLTESITVTAEAPPIQTASQERSAVLNDRQMSYLSTPGRDFMNLLKLLPGVTYPDGYGAQTLGTSSAPVIHGVRTDYVAINLDGVVANNRGLGTTENMVNLDAIAEVKVLLGNYQAEYGKNAGAIINVSTKSGTMEFHGAGYWYKRHEMWNANNFFNNRAECPGPAIGTIRSATTSAVRSTGLAGSTKIATSCSFSGLKRSSLIPPPVSATIPSLLRRRGGATFRIPASPTTHSSLCGTP
jgi:outer membrane receptor protein involved in Fe transport